MILFNSVYNECEYFYKLTSVVSLSTGKVLHSHDYRFAEPFSGQSVVVLGAKASGLDISIELAKAGAQVTTLHTITVNS